MSDRGGPLTSREALLFEDAAGTTVLAAAAQLRAGEPSAAAAAAALLVAGRRHADDVTLEDVFDTFPSYAQLLDRGIAALQLLTSDPEPDGDGR